MHFSKLLLLLKSVFVRFIQVAECTCNSFIFNTIYYSMEYVCIIYIFISLLMVIWDNSTLGLL